MPDRRRFQTLGAAWLGATLLPTLTMTATEPALAQSPPPAPGGLQPLGRGLLRFMGLPIYDAALAVAPGFDPARPEASALALTLSYHRKLAGSAIVDRSVQEMRRGGELAAADEARWRAFMTQAFPDVARGDVIVGSWQPREALSRFAHNGRVTAELADAAFGARFFGIWLAPHTSQPGLRAELLGLKG